MAHQLLFIDFEFTMPEHHNKPQGFFPEIIEVGLVSVYDNVIVDTYTSYVKPVYFPILSNRCKSFLGIRQEDVDNGISFQQLVSLLQTYQAKDSSSTVMTWGNMDMHVLRQNCRFAHLPCPFSGTERDLSLEHMRFYGDKKQTGLWKALHEYGKEGRGKQHRALDDALATFEIYKLVEEDRKYLCQPEPLRLSERIDLSRLLAELA